MMSRSSTFERKIKLIEAEADSKREEETSQLFRRWSIYLIQAIEEAAKTASPEIIEILINAMNATVRRGAAELNPIMPLQGVP